MAEHEAADLLGRRVSVHYNLTTGAYVIAERPGTKVLAYSPCVTLEDVTPRVREGGRQRVIARGQREVHAYLIGTLVSVEPEPTEGLRKLTYNPFRCGSFTVDGEPVEHVARVHLTGAYGWTP